MLPCRFCRFLADSETVLTQHVISVHPHLRSVVSNKENLKPITPYKVPKYKSHGLIEEEFNYSTIL